MDSPAVAVKSPAMVDAANSRAVVPLSIVAWAVVPCVVTLIAPVSALDVLLKVMAMSFTSVVKLDVPDTVNAPVCVRAPPEVMPTFPATVDAAMAVAILLSNVTWALVPCVIKSTAPVSALDE